MVLQVLIINYINKFFNYIFLLTNLVIMIMRYCLQVEKKEVDQLS